MTLPGKTVNDLPYEILVKVFSYLSLQDLVLGVRHVSDYWNEVAQDYRIWKYLPYHPHHNTPESEILNTLKVTPKLQIFKPQGCTRKKILETLISRCKEIRELDVYVDEAGDSLIRKLVKECPNIENLTLIAIDFESTKCMKLISKCLKLKVLKLNGNASVNKYFFSDLAEGCPSLEVLDLKNFYDYSNDDLEFLLRKKRDKITSLYLRWSSERGKCTLPVISCCVNLEFLHVEEYVDVKSNDGFSSLKSVQTLRTLCLPYFRNCNVNFMLDLFAQGFVEKLVKLDLTVYEFFEDRLAWIIFDRCSLLRYLKLVYCPKLTDAGLKPIHQLKHLQHLCVAGCDEITDQGVAYIVKCSKLNYLNLNSCSKLTNESFSSCCTNLKLLRELHMNCCDIAVGPQAVLDVPPNLKALRILDICAYNLNTEAIKCLREQMSSLQLLECGNNHF